MKHPFWIVNSTLLILVVCAFIFVIASRITIPERESIVPPHFSSVLRDKKLEINISKIYENDLFGTFVKQVAPIEEKPISLPFPQPPEPQTVAIPELPIPQFLDPLNITLKGIIIISNDNPKNAAIIEDNKNKAEKSYHINDTIEDAQLIRIWHNKAVFLRSNGQQEVLYLREEDAKKDPAYAIIQDWEGVAQLIGPNTYAISPKEFTLRIQNLAQLLDMLNLTTAYKQGESIGCRIGHIMSPSFGTQLGLETGDTILTVNDIPADSTSNRLKIYKNIIELGYNDTIRIAISRKGMPLSLTYVLKEFTEHATGNDVKSQVKIERIKKQEQERVLKEKYRFAPTINDIRTRERRNMLHKGEMPGTR